MLKNLPFTKKWLAGTDKKPADLSDSDSTPASTLPVVSGTSHESIEALLKEGDADQGKKSQWILSEQEERSVRAMPPASVHDFCNMLARKVWASSVDMALKEMEGEETHGRHITTVQVRNRARSEANDLLAAMDAGLKARVLEVRIEQAKKAVASLEEELERSKAGKQ